MGKKIQVVALLVFFSAGCADLYANNGGPGVPREPTPMRSLRTGGYCLGNSNGVGSWHSSFCESLKCEKSKCVAKCAGPTTQDPKLGCQVSY